MIPLDPLQAGTLLFGLITVGTTPQRDTDMEEEEEEEEAKPVFVSRRNDTKMNLLRTVLIYFLIKKFFWVFFLIIMPCAFYYFKILVLKKIWIVIPDNVTGGQSQLTNMQEVADSIIAT